MTAVVVAMATQGVRFEYFLSIVTHLKIKNLTRIKHLESENYSFKNNIFLFSRSLAVLLSGSAA